MREFIIDIMESRRSILITIGTVIILGVIAGLTTIRFATKY